MFEANGIDYVKPPIEQDNELDLKARFSFKDAAANAGMGWIGKNDLLITEKYGPRVRLGAMLFNSGISFSMPKEASGCPEHCAVCVNACPFKLLSGANWRPGMKREDLIDYSACNAQRSKHKEKHGRKSSCGLCLVSCPIGKAGFGRTSS